MKLTLPSVPNASMFKDEKAQNQMELNLIKGFMSPCQGKFGRG